MPIIIYMYIVMWKSQRHFWLELIDSVIKQVTNKCNLPSKYNRGNIVTDREINMASVTELTTFIGFNDYAQYSGIMKYLSLGSKFDR